MKKSAKLTLGFILSAAFVLASGQALMAGPQDKNYGYQPKSEKADKNKPGADRSKPAAHKEQPRQKPEAAQGPERGKNDRDLNKWDKGWADQNQKGSQGKNRPGHGGQRPEQGNQRPGQKPQGAGIDHDRAWNMAREYKMTGYKPLPQGVKKEMIKGKPLPPKADPRPVPDAMRKRLPVHQGYEWRITGRDLVLVAVGTLIISEIIENVFD